MRLKPGPLHPGLGLIAVVLGALALLGSCGEDGVAAGDDPLSMAAALQQDAGYTMFYESLDDKVLDADLVVVGTVVGVRSAGLESADDGSGQPDEYVALEVRAAEVVHASRAASIGTGDVIVVEIFMPPGRSLKEVESAVSHDRKALFYLFNHASLSERIGERPADLERARTTWIYQDAASVVLEDENGFAEPVNQAPPGLAKGASFEAAVEDARSAATYVSDKNRPEQPLGLSSGE